MLGFPDAASETPAELERHIVKTAENPLFSIPGDPMADHQARQSCLDRKKAHTECWSSGRRDGQLGSNMSKTAVTPSHLI